MLCSNKIFFTKRVMFCWTRAWSCCSCCCCLVVKLYLCNPVDCSQPGFSFHGIFQARILEWAAVSFSRETSPPRDQTCVSCIGMWVLYHWATREACMTLSSTYFYISHPCPSMSISHPCHLSFPVAQMTKSLPAMWETQVQSLHRNVP